MNNFFINPNEQSLYQQYMQMNTDHYTNLEKELQSLSDVEIQELTQYKPYIQANDALSMLVQQELLNLVRMKINSNPSVINNCIDAVKQFKQEKQKETMLFQDYIKNHSDMTYKEYLNMKQNESK